MGLVIVVANNSLTKHNTMVEELRTKRNRAIKHILREMNYEETVEDISKAVSWMQNLDEVIFAHIESRSESPNGTPIKLVNEITKNEFCTIFIPELDTVQKILTKNRTDAWIKKDPFERAKVLSKLADEIEKNGDVISQIEVISRGILCRDTNNKALTLLAEYFHYYSTFAVVRHKEDAKWKPNGIAVGIFSNRNSLSNLGLMLAPALAAGYNIVLQVGTKLCPVATFLLELAKNAGIPDEVIKIIPSDGGEFVRTLINYNNIAIVTLFDDLNDEKYHHHFNRYTKILNMASYKTPLIVFESADLESASISVLESAYGYQGLLPWSVDTVLVQENVLEPFLEKLKAKLNSATKGSSCGVIADIACPSREANDKLRDLIDQAQSLGIEVFQASATATSCLPTLFIGAKVQTNRVLTPDGDQEANALYVVPFMTIEEGINLANNTRQRLAASVWTENIGVMNEVVRKLRVSNIWVNGHGLMAANVAISPIKDSGKGYFGGVEGFYEYINIGRRRFYKCSPDKLPKLVESVVNAINTAKKAQESWYRTSRIKREKLLKNFVRYVEDKKKDFSAKFNEDWANKWITWFYTYVAKSNNSSYSMSQCGYVVNTTIEPRGVVAIETDNKCDMELVLTSLLEGNSVILFALSYMPRTAVYQELSQRLPEAVLKVLPYSDDNVRTAVKHKGLDVYFQSDCSATLIKLPLNDWRIVTNHIDPMDLHSGVTFRKNVWSNVGKSSTCNL